MKLKSHNLTNCEALRSCVHTHTNLCDGIHSPEEMVLSAIDNGFVSLGFSGHGFNTYDPAAMSIENELHYQQEVSRLQEKYTDYIEILLGQEHDALSPYSTYPYEFLIESVHFIKKNGELLSIDHSKKVMEENLSRHYNGDVFSYCKDYYETCINAYQTTPAQIAGHIDLVTKFNEGCSMFDESDPRYLQPALDAISAAVEKDLIIELNTGAISRGYRNTPYPSVSLLRHVRMQGGKIIITSDCHNKHHLTCWYKEAAELLNCCDFTSTLILRKNGFKEIPIL